MLKGKKGKANTFGPALVSGGPDALTSKQRKAINEHLNDGCDLLYLSGSYTTEELMKLRDLYALVSLATKNATRSKKKKA